MSESSVMLITGTSRGVGLGMARYFTQHGFRVAGCSRGPFPEALAGYEHATVDLRDDAQVRGWVRSVKRSLGRIDVLVNNVGLVKSTLLTPVTPTDLFESFYATILRATFLVSREVAKVMIAQRSGRIISIGSTITLAHQPGTAGYSAMKAGVVELTKVLARELEPYNITCNVVAPSLMETETSQALGDEWRARILDLQTIRRPLAIEELCQVVAFFASAESACLTGQVLNTCVVD